MVQSDLYRLLCRFVAPSVCIYVHIFVHILACYIQLSAYRISFCFQELLKASLPELNASIKKGEDFAANF